MRQPTAHKNADEAPEAEKVPFVVAKRIREAILDEVFKPGDRLTEAELVEKFEVSRSPIREALLALEKEGTLIISWSTHFQTLIQKQIRSPVNTNRFKRNVSSRQVSVPLGP
jgi:DNA-binding FadR family transcriptional regulator